MFGRILIPLQEEQVLVIPRQAVREVGQLELVEVVKNGQVSRRDDPHRTDSLRRKRGGALRAARGRTGRVACGVRGGAGGTP